MRVLAVTLAALSVSACTAQTPADAPAAPEPVLEEAAETIDLEALGLVGRARALAPFVGGPLRDAQAAIGGPYAVEQTASIGGSDDGTGVRSTSKRFLYGPVPGVVALEAESGRLVSVTVSQDDVDAYAVVGGLEDEMQDWLGTLDPMNVDHGYYFWDTDECTFTAQAAGDSTVELVVEAK